MLPKLKVVDKKPNVCAVCKSPNIVPVVYGYPLYANTNLDSQIKEGSIIMGGCVGFYNMPDWICKDCKCNYQKELKLELSR